MKWSLHRVLRLYIPQTGAICVALFLLLLGTVFGILKPWPLAFLLDSVLGSKPFPSWMGSLGEWITGLPISKQIILCAVGVFVLHLLSSGLNSIQNFVVIRIGLKGLRKIRKQVFSWVQQLSLGYFLRQKQGDVIYRVCWDTYSFQTLFQHVWFSSAASFISMLSMLWVMWYVNAMLTFISCITLPMMILGIRVYGRAMNRQSIAAHKADSQISTYIHQTISAISVIQSFVRQRKIQEQFDRHNRDAWAKRLRQHGTEIIYQATVAVIFSLGMACITWVGANEVLQNRLSVGELVVFITYLSQFYEPLQKLILAGATLADSKAGVQRVFEILDAKPDIASPQNPTPLPDLTKGLGIELSHVSFGYKPGRPIIKDVSLKIPAGEFVALVGPSGAGKTTLAQLLPRFFDVTQGEVRIGGVDVRKCDLNALRRKISVVTQEPLILPGTVRENILFGRENATEQDVWDIAKQVHADSFITQLPEQYETLIGEGGNRLSVGEMQRICLARALLKSAPILILDEPTSSLDAENQIFVIDALRHLARNKTTLMIAHRLSTLVNASQIIVLVDGQIQNIGTHSELLQTSDYYRRAIAASNMSIRQ